METKSYFITKPTKQWKPYHKNIKDFHQNSNQNLQNVEHVQDVSKETSNFEKVVATFDSNCEPRDTEIMTMISKKWTRRFWDFKNKTTTSTSSIWKWKSSVEKAHEEQKEIKIWWTHKEDVIFVSESGKNMVVSVIKTTSARRLHALRDI